ncbi:MAG TPA: Gfo/Idh/MocA family oxidoreductase [Pyrinomonadaceae bacterium]|jgi:predicted dehydrogenase|nr:Gfo/Idh/MocA family oxidoreductase [Pyrinomonadaceae bacterium]
MIGIGVVGYGYWGPNLVRNFVEANGSKVVAVSDLSRERLALVETRHPSIKTTTDYRELFKDPAVDAVVIATPVSSHFDLTLEALKAYKHVLVEKPLAASSAQAERLIEEALRRQRVLMVDHTFVYTGAVRAIREMVASQTLGDIYYYDSVRVNLGLFQHDMNVIWDLAVHDLSIMDYVLPAKPIAVSATGISNIQGQPENVAYLTLFFPDRQIAHIHVNWLAPVKVRRTLIGGSEKMVVYDDLEPSEKVKIYDKGVTVSALPQRPEAVYEMLVSYRAGDMWAPRLEGAEALHTEAAHFIECIRDQKRPETDGEAGLRIVRILEAATRSLNQRGQLIELSLAAQTA